MDQMQRKADAMRADAYQKLHEFNLHERAVAALRELAQIKEADTLTSQMLESSIRDLTDEFADRLNSGCFQVEQLARYYLLSRVFRFSLENDVKTQLFSLLFHALDQICLEAIERYIDHCLGGR